jgi:hypothetical protein
MLLVSLAVLALCGWALCMTGKIYWGRTLIFSLLAAASLIRLRRTRHTISLTADGLRDRSVYPHVISWFEIDDVNVTGDEKQGYYLELSLAERRGNARPARLSIDLYGIEENPTVVLAAILEHRDAARARQAGA